MIPYHFTVDWCYFYRTDIFHDFTAKYRIYDEYCFFSLLIASDGAGNRFVSGDSTAGDEVCVFLFPKIGHLAKT